MTTEFGIDGTGQYHFFDLVTDPSRLVPLDWNFNPISRDEEVKPMERFTVEALTRNHKIPERLVPENCFIVIGRNGEYVEEGLSYVDKDSGFTRVEIVFEEINPEIDRPVGEKVFKPRKLINYTYEEGTINHPILGKEVKGTLVTTQVWLIDSMFRRRERDNPSMQFNSYEDDWDVASGEPKILNWVVMESNFEEVLGQGHIPVTKLARFKEIMRVFFLPSASYMYVPFGEPAMMTFNPRAVRIADEVVTVGPESSEVLTRVLDEPKQLLF
jgi:hypothetical protein